MDIFQAIAPPVRRTIIELVAKRGELSASEISSSFEISAPAVSQHLKVLREARVLSMKKQGQHRLYRVNPQTMQEVESWSRRMRTLWNQRLDRLEDILNESTD